MGKGGGKTSVNMDIKLDLNKAFKQAVDLVKASKPTSSNNRVVIDMSPKKTPKKIKSRNITTQQQMTADYIVTDAMQAVLDYFEVKKVRADVANWIYHISYDLCEAPGVEGKWIANLKTYVVIKHLAPFSDMTVRVECEAKWKRETPYARISFKSDVSHVGSKGGLATCEIDGAKFKWKTL